MGSSYSSASSYLKTVNTFCLLWEESILSNPASHAFCVILAWIHLINDNMTDIHKSFLFTRKENPGKQSSYHVKAFTHCPMWHWGHHPGAFAAGLGQVWCTKQEQISSLLPRQSWASLVSDSNSPGKLQAPFPSLPECSSKEYLPLSRQRSD